MADVHISAYVEDCVVGARVLVPDGMRLTDYLNEREDIQLTQVRLIALDDGRIVAAGDLALSVAEIHAIEATDPGSAGERRIRTRESEVDMVIGPYRVQGYIHGPTAGDPLAGLSRRKAMIPVTAARIAFVMAGEIQVRERAVVIVNRLLANFNEPQEASSILQNFGLSPLDPRAKDLTGGLYVEPGRSDKSDPEQDPEQE